MKYKLINDRFRTVLRFLIIQYTIATAPTPSSKTNRRWKIKNNSDNSFLQLINFFRFLHIIRNFPECRNLPFDCFAFGFQLLMPSLFPAEEQTQLWCDQLQSLLKKAKAYFGKR